MNHDERKKPFPCEHCEKSFDFKDKRNRHVKYAHKSVHECSKAFSYRKEMEIHMDTVHEGEKAICL